MPVHSFMVCGVRFDVDTRYTLLKPIGQGAYGVVCSAQDNESGDKVAIKKVPKAFRHLMDSKRILREIKLLRHFNHENVITLKDILRPTNYENFSDVYLVTELMDTDLHQIIASPQPLTDEHCQYFVYQILRGLKYIHSADVLHRDLKPSNLLLNGNCDLKICDFGLARGFEGHSSDDYNPPLTEYVATRWYRAPEIMLSRREYTKSVDIWSVGCIFAELLGRRALFPGREYIHQLNLITDVLGTPSERDMQFIGDESARDYLKSLPFKPKIPFETLFPNASKEAIDLLEGMLKFNPHERLTVEEALRHPYLASLHDPEDEPVAESHFDFNFEKDITDEESSRNLVFKELLFFHPEAEEERAAARESGVPAEPRSPHLVAGKSSMYSSDEESPLHAKHDEKSVEDGTATARNVSDKHSNGTTTTITATTN
eukprot:TRINITY_DN9278_c0_g1::TRINITY_DN9278_c0_g1_i1::g.13289::m.13289 TRINITY_DN9278_c0_g1::TRINITY_DN9278_c0_g1_i1::g.13289  ORF type:complete len:471 (+),score=49.41,sp/P42525/ERK1_DICDI/60.68/3e-153,Pkinase/PF00069.20/1.4e-75,Pkinase_Tyr/PF07714.12/1.3e-34,Kdo/PF06293.9/7.8e-07,Kinase-like/PF14531.1/1.5e+02,Kinase-like/PF14531.1/0.048 TRINITY_DN9278_c0_g1_i1:124-1413(+)